MIIINTENTIGREKLFLTLGFVPKKIKQSIASWGEYLSNGDLLLQLHTRDIFHHFDHTYVRVLGNAENTTTSSTGHGTRLKHLEDIEQGQKAYAVFDEKPKTPTYDGYVYELGTNIYQLADGYYIEVIRKLTIVEYLAK